MPSEQHLGVGLTFYVLTHEKLQHLIAHHAPMLIGTRLFHSCIELLLVEIIAVAARQIAGRTNGFGHHVEGTGKGR